MESTERNIKAELFAERNELEEKIGKLVKFIKQPTFVSLDGHMQEIMKDQLAFMRKYFDTLTRRIELL